MCSELVILSSCASISLEKWRQAPRVSLRSVASDPDVVEHCDCIVPVCPESILISSASEAEDAGDASWVKNYFKGGVEGPAGPAIAVPLFLAARNAGALFHCIIDPRPFIRPHLLSE